MSNPCHNTGNCADLHCHSTFSDGKYSPEQLVDLARRSGLSALAITDHDCVQAVAPAREAAGNSLEIIPGIEFTARYRLLDMHILGLFIRPEHKALQYAVKRISEQRSRRFLQIIERLRDRKLSITKDETECLLTCNTLTRRHLAEHLLRTRQVSSIQNAFADYLGNRHLQGVYTIGLPAQEIIGLIRVAGGVAIWAHPAQDLKRTLLRDLKKIGLQGIEVEYPAYSPNRSKQLRQMARDMNLLISGGSDCHGPWPYYQTIGSRGVTQIELTSLRAASWHGRVAVSSLG